jgi:hypothetical protein
MLGVEVRLIRDIRTWAWMESLDLTEEVAE